MIGVKNSHDVRAAIDDGWWGPKILVWLGFIVIAFVIPNNFFQYYGYVSMIGAGFFILIQLVLLIDLAYTWSSSWVRNWEEDDENSRWFIALLSCSIGLYLISLTATILYYVYFCNAQKCYYNIIFVTVNILACVLFTLASISSKVQESNPRTGLLQSGVVTLYATYLIGSSLLSEPETDCNPYAAMSDSIPAYISLALGAIFTIVAVCYSTVRAATSSEAMSIAGTDTQILLENGEKKDEISTSGAESDEVDDESQSTSYSHSFFHLTFALGAMYVGELLTDWATVSTLTYSTMTVDFGWVSVWVKIVSSWLVIVIYCWTVVAPIILPDREWD